MDDAGETAGLRAEAQAFKELRLARPPSGERALELWMQHGAGLLLFEKVRAAGLATLESEAPAEVRAAVQVAVDAAMYALMMQIDGVAGGLEGRSHQLQLTFGVELRKGESVVRSLDLREGDGMCMGFHDWKHGDFGEQAVLTKESMRKLATKRAVTP